MGRGWSRARPAHVDPETRAYLKDYAALLTALAHPSVVYDHRWDVLFANPAYRELFRDIPPHPTAMPDDNLMRFVLFHPDAGSVLAERESRWCLPMLAHLRQALEEHGQDPGLAGIRRDVARDPIMDAAYCQGLPHWLRALGPGAAEDDGSVRPLRHPDPGRGDTSCRVVCSTPRLLAGLGYWHLTFVLREPPARVRTDPGASSAAAPGAPGARVAPGVRRAAGHLRAVPAAEG